jgi:hypothetical protein
MPRRLVDVSKRNTGIELFGRHQVAPFIIAPIGVAPLRKANHRVLEATPVLILKGAKRVLARRAQRRKATFCSPARPIDSGYRRGLDIVKALALGANAVLLGFASLNGLAAAGEAATARRALPRAGPSRAQPAGQVSRDLGAAR